MLEITCFIGVPDFLDYILLFTQQNKLYDIPGAQFNAPVTEYKWVKLA